MISDQLIMHVKQEMLVQDLRRDLCAARVAKPYPHLVYREGHSFTYQMRLRQVTPSELHTTSEELLDLERMGAGLAVRERLGRALKGDLVLENIPRLIRVARHAMRRYKISLDIFGVEDTELHERECLYWHTHGNCFVRRLRKTKGVRGTIESRVWYLHEIRMSMRMGMFAKADLGLSENLHRLAVQHLRSELHGIREKILVSSSGSVEQNNFIQRYNVLATMIGIDLQEFRE